MKQTDKKQTDKKAVEKKKRTIAEILTDIVKFMHEARIEGGRVTWPTRSETVTTSVVVLIMIAIVSVFLTVADIIISHGVQFILGLGK